MGWEKTLEAAMSALDCAKIPRAAWSFGGGTSLMLQLNHRLSRDIDIFLYDVQFLGRMLPPLNSYLEDRATDYAHGAVYVKARIPDGEMDFIAAANLSGLPFLGLETAGGVIQMDSPVETICKKINYRGFSFTPRDMLDLAAVHQCERGRLLSAASECISSEALAAFCGRVRKLSRSEGLQELLSSLARLPGSNQIVGRETELCLEFADEIDPGGRRRHS